MWVALNMLALCTLIPGFHLVNISQIFAVVMLYGAGTDYCLFLISRYREELARGQDERTALARSVGGVGGAAGRQRRHGDLRPGPDGPGRVRQGALRRAGHRPQPGRRPGGVADADAGPAAPARAGRLLARERPGETGSAARECILRPARGVRHRARRRRRALGPDQPLVVARPLLIWAVAVVVLLPLALLGFRVRPNYRATGELSPTASSVRGLAAIQRHFTAGEIGPITVLLEADTRDWDRPRGPGHHRTI